MRRLAFWMGPDVGVVRALVSDVPAHQGGARRSAWAAGFDMIQSRFDPLSGKAHAIPNSSTATAMDAAVIIRTFGPAPGFQKCWWWTTTPCSQATCSWPS